MTPRHDDRRAVVLRKFAVCPHGIDHELKGLLLHWEHRIVAVNDLRLFAWPDLDTLGEVQLNLVAVRAENEAHDLDDLGHQNHGTYGFGLARQRMDAFCCRAIKESLAETSLRKFRIEFAL